MSLYEQELIEDFLENKFTDVIIKLIQDLEYIKYALNEYNSNIQFETFNLLRMNQSFENTIKYLKEIIEGEDILEF